MDEMMTKLKDFYKVSGLSRILDITLAVSYIYIAWIVVHYLSSTSLCKMVCSTNSNGFCHGSISCSISTLYCIKMGNYNRWTANNYNVDGNRYMAI